MLAVLVQTPVPYEVSSGVISGRAPLGARELVVRAGGRRIGTVRLRSRRFRSQALRLPTGDVVLDVTFSARGRTLARRRIPSVFGLPPRALALRPPTLVDGRAQRALDGSRSEGGAACAVWARNLATGRTASWNAAATFPAASTLKLAILLTALGHDAGEPTRGATWSRYERLIRGSSNVAANEVLVSLGGSPSAGGARVNAFVAALGARGTDMYGGYVPEPGERRRPPGHSASVERPAPGARLPLAAELPPASATVQPAYEPGKHTSARDLGLMLTALHGATLGRGPAARLGVTPHEARVALWLLVHADYPGLIAPETSWPVAHKAGWLPRVQHDASIVYTPRGAVVVVVMTHREAGLNYSSSRRYARRVLAVLSKLQG